MESILNKRRPTEVSFTDEDVIITLSDGSKITNPLDWHSWLKNATLEQRQDFELYSSSIFWPELDEGLDIEAILRGVKPKQPKTIQS
jgi:hypothetical protein